MTINIENALRNALRRDERYLGEQLATHLKQLRAAAVESPEKLVAVAGEFFECYRFDDNQMSDDWRKASR